jgi:peptidoglycan hydrolase CwlO-like protein
MTHKNIILLAIIVGLMMGMLGSIYDPNLKSFAQKEEKEQNSSGRMTLQIMDRELKHVDQKFNDIKAELKDINTKIASICDDIVNTKIRAAESGGIYGGGSALVIYLVGILGKSFWSKRKK